MKEFTFEFHLQDFSKRSNNLINILNNMTEFGSPLVTILKAQPISDSQKIQGKIRITVKDDLRVSFDISAPSPTELSLLASKFNMASAHCSNVKFTLINDSALRTTLTPRNKACEEAIENFISMLSASNWCRKQKRNTLKKVFLSDFWKSI